MPVYGVNKEQVEKLYLCRNYGIKFCENNGSHEKICINYSEKDAENRNTARGRSLQVVIDHKRRTVCPLVSR